MSNLLPGLLERMASMEAKLDRLIAQTGPKRPRDDGKVFKDLKEKYWTGDSYAGCAFSECPADFLRAFAKYKHACVWAANEAHKKSGNADELKHVDKNNAQAALALEWAEYHEASGTTASAPLPPKGKATAPEDDFRPPPDDQGEIPF